MDNRLVRVDDLLLDVKNPRHPKVGNQRDAIKALLADGSEKIAALAEDIAEHGLNPADLLIVMPYDQYRYIVLEGNRRLTALKLLHRPDLAKGHTSESRFNWIKESIGKHTNIANEVPCAVVHSRQEARHWLELRHTGERSGAGVVRWSAEAQQRFSPNRGTHADKAMIVIDILRSLYSEDTEFVEYLEKVSSQKLTTFGRLVSDPYARSKLGIDLRERKFTSSDQESMRSIKTVVVDLASDISVSDLKTKEQRRVYIDSIGIDISSSGLPSPDKPVVSPKKPTTRKRAITTPSAPLFDGLELNKLGIRVSAILEELQRLNTEQFPNASSVLIRSIIELSIDQFYKVKNWEDKDHKNNRVILRKKIERCVNEIDDSKKDPKYSPVRRGVQDKNSLFATNTLNEFVHNQYYHPSPTELQTIARNYLYFLKALNDRV